LSDSFKNYIDNTIKLKNLKKFSLIIGNSPSKGARSPILWNKVYRSLKLKQLMLPADIKSENFDKFIYFIKKEKRFLGGAVAVPFKERVIDHLDYIDPAAKKIGAVNIIVNNNGKLEGYNTDYDGCIYTFKNILIKKKRKKILILGFGGAGKSVFFSTVNFFYNSKIYIYNRSKINFFFKKKNKNLVTFLNNLKILKKFSFDIIINATTVGFDSWYKIKNKFINYKYFTPISNLEKVKPISKNEFNKFFDYNKKLILRNMKETLEFINKNSRAFLFDIIYNPNKTVLIRLADLLNIKSTNGLDMNLYQACKGFALVNKFLNKDKIFKIMKN